jgi:hypothetical protein
VFTIALGNTQSFERQAHTLGIVAGHQFLSTIVQGKVARTDYRGRIVVAIDPVCTLTPANWGKDQCRKKNDKPVAHSPALPWNLQF